MNNGWIKLHRSFLDWEWFSCPNTCQLFIYCMLRANHTDTKWRGIPIKRGQFLTSYEKLSVGTGLSIQNIRTCLKSLESTGEISREPTSKLTRLTICKFDTYNNGDDLANKQTNNELTSNQQASNKQVTTDKNKKKEKKDKKEGISSEPAKPAQSSNLDFNYQTGKFNIDIPYNWIEVFTSAYPAVDIDLEISKAKAWLFANPKKRKVDHKAYLNNWLARCQKHGGNIASNKPKKDIRNHNIYD